MAVGFAQQSVCWARSATSNNASATGIVAVGFAQHSVFKQKNISGNNFGWNEYLSPNTHNFLEDCSGEVIVIPSNTYMDGLHVSSAQPSTFE